jgi:type 1 glutamine amidotransferase
MNRRDLLCNTGLAALLLGTAQWPLGRLMAADDAQTGRKKRLLMFTRSQGFQHSCITRGKDDKLSVAEQIVTDLAPKNGFEVVCTKDGRIFLSEDFPKFDGFLFETTGDLCAEKAADGSPPIPQEGKKALFDAIAGGKGFVGCHCATDTFHSPGGGWENQEIDKRDPYIKMIGGEFISHGSQQEATMHIADANFPGVKEFKFLKGFELAEEWYSLKNFAPDLHVILVQRTKSMKDAQYDRPDYPATWARKHEKGRVFYTSMGHREDVWQNELFQKILLGGLAWTLGQVDAEVPPNLDKVAPKASEMPKEKK